MGFPGGRVVKNLPAMQQTGSVPGSRRSPGGGNGNPLQYSCLDQLMDRGAWQATVPGVAKSRMWLSMHRQHIDIFSKWICMCSTGSSNATSPKSHSSPSSHNPFLSNHCSSQSLTFLFPFLSLPVSHQLLGILSH